MRKYKEKYTKDILEEAVNKSFSYAGVLRNLNIVQAGGSQTHIKRRVNYFNINTDHFNSENWMRGKKSVNRKTAEDILVNIKFGNNRVSSKLLTRALIETGRPYECEGSECFVNKDWLGKKITLHVDHVDGNYTHNTQDNLRFLCPNCHSQTDNFGSKNKLWAKHLSIKEVKERQKKDYKIWVDDNNLTKEELQQLINKNGLKLIGKQFKCSESKIIRICKYFNIVLPNSQDRALNTRKAERPSLEQLIEDYKTLSMVKIGKKYGVSDNAIRKWFKAYDYDYKMTYNNI